MKKDATPNRNFHAERVHEMPSGRRVHGVSHSWARAVDETLSSILAEFPDLRFVGIQVPKAERDVIRLFHSEDGTNWRQVHLPNFGPRRYNIRAIVRGAHELDGDLAFSSELNKENLLLREIAGRLVSPEHRGRSRGEQYESLSDWVEKRLRKILDYAGHLYVEGATSEPARKGREHALITIERMIRHLRVSLTPQEFFKMPEDVRYQAQIEGALQRFIIKRHVPFLSSPGDLLYAFEILPKSKKKKIAKGVWADAARMPRNSRFDTIYGALLRQAEGHPIYGDDDYRRLEALLAADLAAGYRVVRLNGKLFIWSNNRWRAATTDPRAEADWNRGEIISRNYGRVIVPPHRKHGELMPGYTRNGPGEGPAERRPQAVIFRCVDRPIPNTNLQWLHAYHAWELENGT